MDGADRLDASFEAVGSAVWAEEFFPFQVALPEEFLQVLREASLLPAEEERRGPVLPLAWVGAGVALLALAFILEQTWCATVP